MKIKDILNWDITAFNRITREFIEGDDIQELSINASGIVVFYKK